MSLHARTWNLGAWALASAALLSACGGCERASARSPQAAPPPTSRKVEVRGAHVAPAPAAGRHGIFPDPHFRGTTPVLAVDAKGVDHLAYAGISADGKSHPVRYGECAKDCRSAASWTFISLGDYGNPGLGGGVRMALDAHGHPRVLWFTQQVVGGASAWWLAACDAGCTQKAHWRKGAIGQGDFSTSPLTGDSFALGPKGSARYIFMDGNGVNLARCEADCTKAASWTSSTIGLGLGGALRFTSEGHPRVVYESLDDDVLKGNDVYYAACDSDCGKASSWKSTALFPLGANVLTPFDFALTARGAPRLVFYEADTSANGPSRLTWAWCDAGCARTASWHHAPVDLPRYSGHSGLALALSGAGEPRLMYGGSPDGVKDETANVAVCGGGCVGAHPSWRSTKVESKSDIRIPAPDPCHRGDADWQLGANPSLTVGPSGGWRAAYDTSSYASCGAGWDYQKQHRLIGATRIPGRVRYAEP